MTREKDELAVFLKKVFPNMTIKQGSAVWWLLQNADVFVKGNIDINGGFRGNGETISKVTGKGDYMHYYCASPVEHIKSNLVKSMDSDYMFTLKYAKEMAFKFLNHPELRRINASIPDAPVWSEIRHEKLWKIINWDKDDNKILRR